MKNIWDHVQHMASNLPNILIFQENYFFFPHYSARLKIVIKKLKPLISLMNLKFG